jgi:hypothetical protein
MARYLDHKNDLTFKRIIGEHPDLLIGFLNAVTPLSSDRTHRSTGKCGSQWLLGRVNGRNHFNHYRINTRTDY